MPLSEEEQRILQQIEQQFYESDPAFSQRVSQTTLYRHALRRVVLSVGLLVVGLAFLVATLQFHVAIAFCGFLVMLFAAFVIEKNLRAMGRAGLEQVTANLRGNRLSSRKRSSGTSD
jgi:hypothetical protein